MMRLDSDIQNPGLSHRRTTSGRGRPAGAGCLWHVRYLLSAFSVVCVWPLAPAAGAPEQTVIVPRAVPLSSGLAFPAGRKAGNAPDRQYAAERAIDGDPASFCCLLDDTCGGQGEQTIPLGAAAPVTGYMVFDLGAALPVSAIRLQARDLGSPVNPKEIELFTFAADTPDRAALARADGPRRLNEKALPPLRSGAVEEVAFPSRTARYVGLRVRSSYESGPIHYNFQLAEVEFRVDLPGDRLPAHVRRAQGEDEPRLADSLAALRRAVDDLEESFGPRYPARQWRDRARALEADLAAGCDAQAIRLRLAALRRDALVASNPLLAGKRIVFVKRFTYSPGWYYAEFMRASRFGGNLCLLSLADGAVTELAPSLKGGIFDRYDLSFDARRIVFAWKPEAGKGFRLWEVGVDGSGLRQLTLDPEDEPQRVARYCHPQYRSSRLYMHHTDDFHPCYLPGGGVCFASTRCERGVLCDQGDTLSVNLLYRLDAGGRITRLSDGALSESTPSLLPDGRILYTRWEYVDKGVIAVQGLWAMRPDGRGSREIYGNDIEFPPVFIHARAIPHRSGQLVCTGTMHHPFAVGPILHIDTSRRLDTQEPIRSLTPDTSLSIEGPGGYPSGEAYTHWRGGRWVRDNKGPLFSEPWPLAEPGTGAGAGKYFLVTCNPDKPWNHPTAYGLWLIDVFGNRVEIYRDEAISCWQPILLEPRPQPPVPADMQDDPPADRGGPSPHRSEPPAGFAAPASGEATLVMTDVHEGLAGLPRGSVKYLRVLEQVARPWAARRFWPGDAALGQHAIISLNAHIHVKVHHGVVAVREDGSACFSVPARRNLFFQALDAQYQELQRMRTFVNLREGEIRGCTGCHAARTSAPARRDVLALREPPARLQPQPGETVPRPIHYVTDVQPILDAHCVRCHGESQPKARLDLSGQPTTYFNVSYESLITRRQVAFIQEFIGPQFEAQKTNVVPLPPRALGSHASPLIARLRKGHNDVKLTPGQWARLVTWADANAPYYGTYFGKRNLQYRNDADFRPVPTLESALGNLDGPGMR